MDSLAFRTGTGNQAKSSTLYEQGIKNTELNPARPMKINVQKILIRSNFLRKSYAHFIFVILLS